MTLKEDIWKTFGPTVFHRPLFYTYPGGLRFGLSETGSELEQFLLALRKATQICRDIFIDDSLVVCLRTHSTANRFGHRATLESLRSAGIVIPAWREVWSEAIDQEDWYCDSVPEYWIYLAFKAPVSLLESFLWCALAKDFRAIQPNPGCDFYLFNMQKKVLAFPYDDRGMDVVGPNKEMLSALYEGHRPDVLKYDQPADDK